jgi:hypothetical protein
MPNRNVMVKVFWLVWVLFFFVFSCDNSNDITTFADKVMHFEKPLYSDSDTIYVYRNISGFHEKEEFLFFYRQNISSMLNSSKTFIEPLQVIHIDTAPDADNNDTKQFANVHIERNTSAFKIVYSNGETETYPINFQNNAARNAK